MKTHNQTFQGKVQHVDLEGGYYTLVTPSGEIYKLESADSSLYQNDQQVEIEGSIKQQSFGIGFGTPVLMVHRFKRKS